MRRPLFLLLIFHLLLWAGSSSAAGPRLLVEKPEYDFGKVLQGDRVEHVFSLRNAGEKPLSIERVRSSCGCTAALLSAAEIPPGQSGEVRANFDSGRFRGPVEKTITLYTNDPTQPTSTLRIRGRVLPVLEARPADIDLGTVVSGQRREKEVTLVNRGEETIVLNEAYATNPVLQVSLGAQSIPAGGSVLLTVSAAGEGDGKPLSGYVIVKTGSPRLPQLRISVYGSAPAGR